MKKAIILLCLFTLLGNASFINESFAAQKIPTKKAAPKKSLKKKSIPVKKSIQKKTTVKKVAAQKAPQKKALEAQHSLTPQSPTSFSLQTNERVVSSTPLIARAQPSPITSDGLTVNGIFYWTNTQRTEHSTSSPLTENSLLNSIAVARMEDIIDKQYFDHVSPSGDTASSEARRVGYRSILIGENLALGTFNNDPHVVQAWMDSPGHRANILRSPYTEMGVAAKQGYFKGDRVWFAVQIFGRPLSLCPQPDEVLKESIETRKDLLTRRNEWAQTTRSSLQESTPKTLLEIHAYNSLVEEYNASLRSLQELNNVLNADIGIFNSQVALFNTCLKE